MATGASPVLAALHTESKPDEKPQAEAEAGNENKEPEEPLIDTLQKRLEELLSKPNLEKDAYIQQHMNAQMYIPLAIVARHTSICVLGDDKIIIETAKEAAKRSDKFSVDDDGLMVRPLLKPRRNTLILHDLPEVFPEEELKALFNSSPESEAFQSLKPDVNNTAFVSFKTDDAAQNCALWLRSQKLQGNEIKCAMKAEHFVRSFFPATGSGAPDQSPFMGPQNNQAWGYPGWMTGNMAWTPGSQGEMFGDPAMGNMGWSDDYWGDGMAMGAKGSKGSWDGKGDGKGKSPKGKGKGKGRMRGSLGGSFSQDSAFESGSDFASPQMPPMAQPDGELLEEPGYEHNFRKYSRHYIIEICNGMEDIVKPESFEKCERNDVALFRATPCKDWAPLPTPMNTFSANFFGDDRRGSTDGDSEMGRSDRPRKESKGGKGGSKGKKGKEGRDEGKGKDEGTSAQPEGQDYEESSDWKHGDDSWWFGKSWSGSWDYKQSDGGYNEKQWVKKEDAKEAEQDGDKPRTMSWADKVKGVDSSERGQSKWVAKTKGPDDTQSNEKDIAAGPAAEAADSAACAPEAKEATEPTKGAAAAASSTPSWADKVRASASK